MASNGVRALEASSTLTETKQAVRRIVRDTNTDHDSISAMQYRNDVVRAGGLKAIIKAMKDHADDGEMQDLACQALSNLSYENDKIRVLIAQLGGVRSVLAAMTAHVGNEELQWHAMQTLWRLSFNDLVRSCIVKEGGDDVVRMVMKEHPTNHKDVQFWGELTISHLRFPTEYGSDGEGQGTDADLPDWLVDLLVVLSLVIFFRSLY
jgi:hypothetical protein